MENKTYKEKKIEILRQLIETDNITVEELFPVPVITPQKEEEYTILMFERVKSVGTYDRWWTLRDNGHYSASGDGVCTLNIMMNIGCSVKDGSFRIYQIRRNSDKSVWTVRDKYVSSQAPLLGIRTIEKFVIDNESIGIRAVEAISVDPITTSLKYLTVPVPVEPTWVIEEFQQEQVSRWYIAPDGKYNMSIYRNDKTGTYTLLDMLSGGGATVKNGMLTIESVRADKNSPVISISDWVVAECTHMGNTPMQVEGFVVNDRNNLLVKTRQFRTHGVNIENCRKVDAPVEKKPLFTTEDGVDIYDNRILYTILDAWSNEEKYNSTLMSDIRYTILDGTEKNWHVFSSPTAAQAYIDSKKQKPAVQPEQEQIAKVGEYVIGVEHTTFPDKAVRVTEVIDNGMYYKYLYPDGHSNGCSASWCRIATQQEIDRDWKKEEKVEPLIQVLLTRKQINKLIEILK